MLAGNPAAPSPSFESIATASPNGSTVSFSSIPSGFKHLQIRYLARASYNFGAVQLRIRLNGSSSTIYDSHALLGDGSTASAYGYINQSGIIVDRPIPGNNQLASTFATGVIDILDYGSTTKNKTIRTFAGYDLNGSGQVGAFSGLSRSTSAVTSIEIDTTETTNTFVNGSVFSLYGIKES